MGTSALEGARLGIPTILLDIFYGDVPNEYQFRWLHKRSGYTLGEIQPDNNIDNENNSLMKRVQELYTDHAGISVSAREYYRRNHSLESVCNKFLDISKKVNFTYSDMVEARLAERGVAYSFFVWVRKTLVNTRWDFREFDSQA